MENISYIHPSYTQGGSSQVAGTRMPSTNPSVLYGKDSYQYQNSDQSINAAALEECILAQCTIETRDRPIVVREVQVLERVIPVPKKVQCEKIINVPKIETVERIINVPKPVYEKKIIEVVETQYKEVQVEKIVEHTEYEVQYVRKEIPCPECVDVPIIQPAQAPVEQEIQRNVPVLIDLITTHGYEMPRLKPKYTIVKVPIFMPVFIEVPHDSLLLLSHNNRDTSLNRPTDCDLQEYSHNAAYSAALLSKPAAPESLMHSTFSRNCEPINIKAS